MQPELAHLKQTLQSHAQQQPQRLALWGDSTRVDYGHLLDEVQQREAVLREAGVAVFALALENGPQALFWDLAALFAGVTCVILPPFFSPAQRAHCLQQSGAGLVLAEETLGAELQACGYRQDGEFWRPQQGVAGLSLLPGTAKITYTSGTTGTPKGVCLSGETMLRVARELELVSRAKAPQHYLAVLPLAVLLENLGIYAALLAGATVSLPSQRQLGISGASGVDWPRLLGMLMARGAQSLILVPQLLLGLVTAIERGAVPASGFRFIAVGGAKVSPDLLQRAARVGLPVFEGYGLSECASVVCLNRPDASRPGSVGRPLPHVQVRLAEDGEVLVQGSILNGYLGEPAFTGQWWPTGDIGEFDADGYLYLRGRKKHQFVTSFGRNVNPEWVEAELTQRGVIAQAFVHGESLPRNVALLWPLDPSCPDAMLASSVSAANQSLPDYARVSSWIRLNEPFTPANGLLTANGRPRREAILARYQNLLAEPVTP
ncbi:long-chain acyl-CoA synthetase [Pseudomonas alcaligenes]|uniref:Long-chain acyl-CoA synthetase n=1 Tax=Aquipseudomonas alcaligenes TaxID=43263 RepID=A0ABR7S118_AQUAC|nr:AMP-binding protein [Pseudomonas alcaligenes]MBC9250276.1 long-chain acyl-CoA synthetase [Pseudomonas alcaligenes]